MFESFSHVCTKSDRLQRAATNSSILLQLRKIKDLPRILQRLRLTQGLLDSRDFQVMLDRCSHTTCLSCKGHERHPLPSCWSMLTETDSIPRLSGMRHWWSR